MTITIRQDIHDYDSLSKEAKIVLGFIPGGFDWVADVSRTQTANYVFVSEAEFLSAVLDGLHNTSLLYVYGVELLIDPEKLLSTGYKPLHKLSACIDKGKFGQANEVLLENGLYSNLTLFQKIQKFLKYCGVSSNGLFQIISLSDAIALFRVSEADLVKKTTPKIILKDAAAFALSSAQTAKEFCQLFGFYLTVTNKLGLNSSDEGIRLAKVSQVQLSLTPFANEMLNCPQISGSTSDEDIDQAISTWLDFGNEFGFASLPAALEQIALNIPLHDLYETSLAREVSNYQSRISNYMRNRSVGPPTLSQDGQELYYRVDNQGSHTPTKHPAPLVQFSLNTHGCLVLDEFVGYVA